MENVSLKYCPKAKKERKKEIQCLRKLAENQLTSGLLIFKLATSSKQCHVIIDENRHFGSVLEQINAFFSLWISTLGS